MKWITSKVSFLQQKKELHFPSEEGNIWMQLDVLLGKELGS